MKKRWKHIIVINLIFIPLIILIIYNIRYNCSFFYLSISSLLTFFTAIFISYYLVQKNTDQRYQKEIYRNLLMDVQKLVADPDTYTVSKRADITTITAKKRSLSNYIGLMESHCKKFDLEEEVIFIKDKFEEYNDLIGDHITDITYLKNSKKEIQRPLDLISGKLYEMMLKLYS